MIRGVGDAAATVREVLTPDQQEWIRRHGVARLVDYGPDWVDRMLQMPIRVLW